MIAKPDNGIITGRQLTQGAGEGSGDGTVGAALLAADATISGPVDALGDSAYGTADLLATVIDAGHTPIVKPWPTRPNIPGGFDPDDFGIDHTAGTITCSVGHTAVFTPTRDSDVAAFGTLCADCPLRARCTTAKKGRTITLRPATRCCANTPPRDRPARNRHPG
ncbi:hypothetical protein [Candidatus Protofrankia californiensis]|uniref:hypothetical protein n=1 Tax=Candidatus Protofrankia californiensis TaxID=1839754 RepID=UPI003D348A1D